MGVLYGALGLVLHGRPGRRGERHGWDGSVRGDVVAIERLRAEDFRGLRRARAVKGPGRRDACRQRDVRRRLRLPVA